MDWIAWIKQNVTWIVGCILIGLLGVYIGLQITPGLNSITTDGSELTLLENNQTTSEEMIKVYVCGEVKQNQVVELSANSRWEDAILAVGGLSPTADSNQINLAKPLKNGDKVFVPKKIPVLPDSSSVVSLTKSTVSSLIPINSASKEDLMALPGIGEMKAEAIIQYREENGRFDELEDLMKVSGIGQKTFDKLKEQIRLD